MLFCALDLELEQPKTNHQTPDSHLDVEAIIQVGWVIYEVLDNGGIDVKESHSKFVNIGVPLSAFIKKLTKIKDSDIESGGTLEEAYLALANSIEKHKACRVIQQWGGGDIECLKQELEPKFQHKIWDWTFGRSGLNVKHLYQAYATANGMSRSGGLSKCMGRLGLKWLGQGKHNATIDALNTAQMYALLSSKLKENK